MNTRISVISTMLSNLKTSFKRTSMPFASKRYADRYLGRPSANLLQSAVQSWPAMNRRVVPMPSASLSKHGRTTPEVCDFCLPNRLAIEPFCYCVIKPVTRLCGPLLEHPC